MAYSVSSAATYPNTEFYRASENRDSKFVQPEEGNLIEVPLDSENTSSVAVEDSNKDLKSRAVVVLSNTNRNVAIIETVRFLAIVGLVCSAVASVLLPALGFAAIAASACVLKNRVIQLDARTLQDSDRAIEEVADQTFSRSPSMRSQTREPSDNGSIGRLRGASIATNSMSPISEEPSQKVEVALDVKEAFLGSLENRSKLSRESLRGLLGVCFSTLSKRIAEMPETLSREGVIIDHGIRTQAYLERKCEEYPAKFSESTDLVNEKQKLLENVKPSSVMEIAKELYTQISEEEKKFGNKKAAKHYAENAVHATGYIDQLKSFEIQKELHFTEDANQA